MSATGTAEVFRIGQLEIRFLDDGSSTAGAAALFEFAVPPHAKVPAAHSHDGYEETLYGLRGVLRLTIAEAELDLEPGRVVTIPRGVVHRFDNVTEAEGAALAIVTPAALGPEYFRDLEAVFTAATGGPPDPAAVAETMRRHGLTPHA